MSVAAGWFLLPPEGAVMPRWPFKPSPEPVTRPDPLDAVYAAHSAAVDALTDVVAAAVVRLAELAPSGSNGNHR